MRTAASVSDATIHGDTLLLHGFTGSPQSFASLKLNRARVFAPTLLGHTGSTWVRETTLECAEATSPEVPMPSPDASLDAAVSADWGLLHGGFVREVDRLAQFLAEHDFRRGHVVGYSLGARLALGLLVRHPDAFERATLIGVHPGLSSDEARQARLSADVERCRALLESGVRTFIEAWEAQPLFASQRALPEAVRQAQRANRLHHSAWGLCQSLLQCGLGAMPDWRPQLATVSAAVTFVTGELDAKFDAVARGLVSDCHDARHVVIEGAGHNPLLERPDAVRALLHQG